MRIYIDTSVIGGCFDPEFTLWSNRLIGEIKKGRMGAVVSDLTLQEIEKAPSQVSQLLSSLPLNVIDFIELNDEARKLPNYYIEEGAIKSKHIVDAQHIALATTNRVDFMAS